MTPWKGGAQILSSDVSDGKTQLWVSVAASTTVCQITPHPKQVQLILHPQALLEKLKPLILLPLCGIVFIIIRYTSNQNLPAVTLIRGRQMRLL